MPATQQSATALSHSKLSDALAAGRHALEELRKQLAAYDAQHKTTETALSYLKAPLDTAQCGLHELTAAASALKKDPRGASAKALSTSLDTLQGALRRVSDGARAYDAKYGVRSTVTETITHPTAQLQAALHAAGAYAGALSTTAGSKLSQARAGLRARVAGASTQLLEAAKPRASALTTFVQHKAQELDARFAVSGYVTAGLKRAEALDTRFAGGRVSPLLVNAYQRGLGYLSTLTAAVQPAVAATPAGASPPSASPQKAPKAASKKR